MKKILIVSLVTLIIVGGVASIIFIRQKNIIRNLTSKLDTKKITVNEPNLSQAQTTSQKTYQAEKPITITHESDVKESPKPAPTAVVGKEIKYSDFVLTYSCERRDEKIPCQGSQVVYKFNTTTRDVRITKIAVRVQNLDTADSISYHFSPDGYGNNVSFNMKDEGGGEWSQITGINGPNPARCGEECNTISKAPFVEIMQSGSVDSNVVIIPEFDKWTAWDYTSNQPVRIQPKQ